MLEEDSLINSTFLKNLINTAQIHSDTRLVSFTMNYIITGNKMTKATCGDIKKYLLSEFVGVESSK
jgi:hypothetical protein